MVAQGPHLGYNGRVSLAEGVIPMTSTSTLVTLTVVRIDDAVRAFRADDDVLLRGLQFDAIPRKLLFPEDTSGEMLRANSYEVGKVITFPKTERIAVLNYLHQWRAVEQ